LVYFPSNTIVFIYTKTAFFESKENMVIFAEEKESAEGEEVSSVVNN